MPPTLITFSLRNTLWTRLPNLVSGLTVHQLYGTMSDSTTLIESAKRRAAEQAVKQHFSSSFTYVGVGSGSTIKYVVDAIAEQLATLSKAHPDTSAHKHKIAFVPTGYQSRQVILAAGLTPLLYDQLPDDVILDVAFDGADEVDEDLNCIKGGGACLFQEKLVAQRAKKFVCVADYRKLQPRLLTFWPSIPIEVAPIAAPSVLISLRALGSSDPQIRLNPLAKSGPLKTDQDFYIIDAPFGAPLLTSADADVSAAVSTDAASDAMGGGKWTVDALAERIRAITGVLEVGLFCGIDGVEAEAQGRSGRAGQKPVAVYFGMADGSVELRLRKEKKK